MFSYICACTHAETRRLYFTGAYFQPVMVAIWSGSILKQTNKQKTTHSYNVTQYFILTSVNAICVSHLSYHPQAENTKPTVHTMLEHALNIYVIWYTHMRAPLPFKSFTDSQNAIRCPHLAALSFYGTWRPEGGDNTWACAELGWIHVAVPGKQHRSLLPAPSWSGLLL